MWNFIQNNIPEMAGNTAIVLAPEQGRNLESNNIIDANGFRGYDHSDANTRRVFGMMAGPGIQSNISIGSEGNSVGDLLDITPTIAEILGCKQDIMNTGLVASNTSLFDLM